MFFAVKVDYKTHKIVKIDWKKSAYRYLWVKYWAFFDFIYRGTMHISVAHTPYIAVEHTYTFERKFPKNIQLFVHIALHTDKFLEYQKELFHDFISSITELLSREDGTIETFKETFEIYLHDFNAKLGIFVDKIKDQPEIRMSGIVQIFWDWEYIASLIGSTSVLIFRNEKHVYTVCNPRAEHEKIDQFSEFIEGVVQDDDKIIVVWTHVDTYLDEDDVHGVLEVSGMDGVSIVESLVDLLSVRVKEGELWFSLQATVENLHAPFHKHTASNSTHIHDTWLSKNNWRLTRILWTIRSTAMMAIWWIMVFLVLYWIIMAAVRSNTATPLDGTEGLIIDFTIDDIQRDIGLFQRIAADSDDKIVKYNDIVAKLDILQWQDKWTFDVVELRKILEKEYVKWFNIIALTPNSGFSNPVFGFGRQEKEILWEPHTIARNNGFYVWWSKWAMVGVVNDTARWALISTSLWTNLLDCHLNLLKNGLYCVSSTNEVYNVTKAWMVPIELLDEGRFPLNMERIATFPSSSMYVVGANVASLWAKQSIFRFQNQRGSQDIFQPWTEYLIPNWPENEPSPLRDATFWDLAVDGTFLSWIPEKKELWQLWRVDNAGNMMTRRVPISGGDRVASTLSEKVKVFSTFGSRYVYLFDSVSQQILVYRSAPLKTNDAYTTSYSLKYFFSIKVDFGETKALDMFIEEWEKAMLYLLTPNAIHAVKLHEIIDGFIRQEQTQWFGEDWL
jgi:hypothetical protein